MEEQRAKMELRNAKSEEIKLYGTMLSGPNLDAAARARVAMLFVTATEKLQEMDQSGPCGDGGPGGDFTSPSNPSSSGPAPGTVRQQALVWELLVAPASNVQNRETP